MLLHVFQANQERFSFDHHRSSFVWFCVLVLTVLYQTLAGMVTMPHEFETAVLCCIWLDSVINPLWTAFISKRPIQSNNLTKFTTFSSKKSSKWRLKQPGSLQDLQRKTSSHLSSQCP